MSCALDERSAMARRLFIIEDLFTVPQHGLVVLPGIVPEGDEEFRVGDSWILSGPTDQHCSIELADSS
jgi:hypothetical protein